MLDELNTYNIFIYCSPQYLCSAPCIYTFNKISMLFIVFVWYLLNKSEECFCFLILNKVLRKELLQQQVKVNQLNPQNQRQRSGQKRMMQLLKYRQNTDNSGQRKHLIKRRKRSKSMRNLWINWRRRQVQHRLESIICNIFKALV